MKASSIDPDALDFARDGARLFAGATSAALSDIEAALAPLGTGRAGTRIHNVAALRPLLAGSGAIGGVAAALLGEHCRAVRAIMFDKTPATNWALGWHQDRTIAVVRRIEMEGFGPWTVKSGLQHVAPPFELLGGMVTLRVHIDPVPAANAPLLIAPGSHRFGRISEDQINALVERCGTMACIAEAGDVWAYATPILHASDAAAEPGRRRVLQVDYAAVDLPGGSEWLGV